MDREEFEEQFQDEHQTILTTVKELVEKLRNHAAPDISEEVDELNKLLGPHFRYEEEALYPSLREEYGRIYVKRLYDSHEGTIHTLRTLKEGEDGSLNTNEALDAIYGWLLPHVSDCEGLSIMVGQIPGEDLDEIAEARERAHEEELDLLAWAEEVRENPDFGTLTILNS